MFNYFIFVKVGEFLKNDYVYSLICSDLLFKYFYIIVDLEKLFRGRGLEGYLSLLGGV